MYWCGKTTHVLLMAPSFPWCSPGPHLMRLGSKDQNDLITLFLTVTVTWQAAWISWLSHHQRPHPCIVSQHKLILALARVFLSQWQEKKVNTSVGIKLRFLKRRCDIYLKRHLDCLGREDAMQGQERNEIHYFTIWLPLGIWSEAPLQKKLKSAWWSPWSNPVEKVLQEQVLYLSFLAFTFIWDY